MQNGTATLGASLAVSYNVTHGLILQSSNEALRCLSKYIENLCSYKNLYTNVYSSFLCNCPNWKQPRCLSKDKWIKKTVLYPDNEILLSDKKK